MTGLELKMVRRRLDLSVVQFGLLLGYQGNDATINTQVRRYEGRDEIPEYIGRLAHLLYYTGLKRLPADWLRDAGIDA